MYLFDSPKGSVPYRHILGKSGGGIGVWNVFWKFLFGTLGLCPVHGDLYPAGQHGGVFVLHFPVGAKCCRIYETEHSRDFACMGSLSGQVGNAAFDLANDLCGWSGKMGRWQAEREMAPKFLRKKML